MTVTLPDDPDAWAAAWRAALADRPAFAAAADGFTAAFCFRITPDEQYDGDRIDVRFVLEDGECTALNLVDDSGTDGPDGANATAGDPAYDYLLQAPYAGWKSLLQGDLDVTEAVMGGPFDVAGDTMTLLQRKDAVGELVAAARDVETEFSC